ncbi:hypothetical protein [Nonomuraea roseoviolacea]|uniref:Uncharacterized protein n=1 Tax=Nonomuraea roseoviolacea subsp. carminata TaxID=160689 RepID=A0ABT1K1P2_9ACTN|nr:hypothetical protein [Nonomuraea roseoviolacea]MCP2346924.1 hypothetical protein [Nonomuraea roseoviolacea subsp. carminata]
MTTLPQYPFGREPLLAYQGNLYRLIQGRILLHWDKPPRPVLRHRVGCVLCCDVRVQGRPGSPPRHPKNCTNCLAYTGPRPDPCWTCGKTAHFHDDDGRPTHKVCLETAITLAILTDAERARGAA